MLYEKKKTIEKLIEGNTNIDETFKHNYLKHISLYDIFVFDDINFNDTINSLYSQYIDLYSKNFVNIMKDFTKKDNYITNMFTIIHLLLFGNEEKINMANLLFGMVKDKKKGNHIIADIIYNNLDHLSQTKLKKANINLKEEADKFNSITNDDIDYKSQLLSSKRIPDIVKSLTIEKIDEMNANNSEYYKQLLFVKTILRFPWPSDEDDIFFKNISNNRISFMDNVKNNLKKLSYGHKEAKKTLLKIVGRWITNPNSGGSVVSFVGPPGVGKTLLAKSVGNALNIPFVQITLGGQNDGELLHGHGYTYSGAQPGMIIKKMIEAGKSRCILYFDELDKACAKHGQMNEITSILIHMTDPNMNRSFQDRFFQGVDFPLDKVIMMFSYNDSNLIDPILLDRFKEIEVKPYTTKDKIKIVQEFIIPEIIKIIGFNDMELSIGNDDIEYIIDKYTMEAGVRDIKRKIEDIFLKLNIDRIYKKGLFKNDISAIIIDRETIIKILDKPISNKKTIHKTDEIGIINGLFATSNGNGGIIPIQIFSNYTITDERNTLRLTGNQGDVMKESVQCALTASLDYISRNIEKLGITSLSDHMKDNFPYGFHVHAPNTSTPKDGPSAGCAFTTAFISRILNIPIRHNIAMTGEIDLKGNIMKIGGLQYKLIGAKNAGVNLVLVPKENQDDIENIIKENNILMDQNFKIELVESIDEVIDKSLI